LKQLFAAQVSPEAQVQVDGVSGAAHVLVGAGDPESMTVFDPASVVFFPASVVVLLLLPESPPLSP
jgi:hypothetical protein